MNAQTLHKENALDNQASDGRSPIPLRAPRSLRLSPGAQSHAIASASLVAMVVVLYWPTVKYGFVNWDDPWYVVNNSLIKSWHPANLFDVATRVAIRNYAPLTQFVYLIQHTLWGLWPGGYHATNFLLHATNAVLVYFLVERLTGKKLVGWGTAALFAVHPIQIETVAWVSSLKGLLSGTFLLASLLYWLRPNRTARDEAFGLLYYVLSLLAKALAIVQPAIVFAYDVLVRRVPVKEALSRQIIPGFLAVWLLLVTMSAQTTEIGGVRGHLEWSKARIVAVDTVILWKYVGMLMLPTDLCVLYDLPTDGISGVIAFASAGWLLVAIAAWRLRKRQPLIPLALVAFFAFLFPVLNFFPITTLMNDRYLYIPAIPIFALFFAGIDWLLVSSLAAAGDRKAASSSRWAMPMIHGRMAAFTLGACVVAAFGTATYRHLPVWQNGLTLWEDAVQHAPQLPVVRIQLADALHDAGRAGEAVSLLEGTLVETRPDEADRRRIERKLGEWQPVSGTME